MNGVVNVAAAAAPVAITLRRVSAFLAIVTS
jgi:hypothetical protein